MDDSETATLILYADSGENYLGEKFYLVIRCQSSEVELYIGWNKYLGSEALVTSRVGSEKAIKKYWSLFNSYSCFKLIDLCGCFFFLLNFFTIIFFSKIISI
mgnify:CR=1 FL=1